METISNTYSYEAYRNTSDESVGAALGVIMVLILFASAFFYALPAIDNQTDSKTVKPNAQPTTFETVSVQPTAALDSGDTSMN